MFVAVLREAGKPERWVWSNGQTFTEITEPWLLEERRRIAAKEAVHTDPRSFFKEVGIPFAETLPNGTGEVEVELPEGFAENVAQQVMLGIGEALRSAVRAELNATRLVGE